MSATISLGGKPESGVFDNRTNLFYQNLEDTSAIAAVDLIKRVVTMRWPLQDCLHPTGMAIDEQSRQLFIGCSGNSRLAVFDLEQHRVVTSVPVGGGPDSVAYDAGLHRIYVTGRAGDFASSIAIVRARSRRSIRSPCITAHIRSPSILNRTGCMSAMQVSSSRRGLQFSRRSASSRFASTPAPSVIMLSRAVRKVIED